MNQQSAVLLMHQVDMDDDIIKTFKKRSKMILFLF